MTADAAGGAPELPQRRIAAAVILRAGRVLVQTRTAGPWAGWWEFPGGGLEPGEDEPTAATRECREELSLEVRPLQTLHATEWSYPTARVHVTFILCHAEGDPQPTEGQQFHWATAQDLDTLRFLPANAEVLALLRDRLSRP